MQEACGFSEAVRELEQGLLAALEEECPDAVSGLKASLFAVPVATATVAIVAGCQALAKLADMALVRQCVAEKAWAREQNMCLVVVGG